MPTCIGLVFLAMGLATIFIDRPSGTQTASAVGQISNIQQGEKSCWVAYDFVVDGQQYTGSTSFGSSDFCRLRIQDSVEIHYDPAHPTDNSWYEPKRSSSSLWGGLIFAAFGAFGLVVGLLNLIRFKTGDATGDGLYNDGSPATDEQMKLIENGFRELGRFHELKKRPNQAEAREILDEINKQRLKKSSE
jgi:hypothetical protein